MKKIILKTPEIFSFKECLRFLSRSTKECLFLVENNKVQKVFFFNEVPFLIDISQKGYGFLEVNFLNAVPTEDQMKYIKNYINKWLDLTYDLTFFYKKAKKDKILAPLISSYKGLRLIGIPDIFEVISWAIIGQLINLNFAYQVKRNLVFNYGKKFTFEKRDYFQFPSPEIVLSIPKESFKEMKFSKQKTAYLQRLAKDLVEKNIDLDAIGEMEYQPAKLELLKLYGIGNWTADYVLMKTFRHSQAFPIQDAGLQNALKRQLGLSTKPKIDEILGISKNWKGHEAYATFYLWRSLYD